MLWQEYKTFYLGYKILFAFRREKSQGDAECPNGAVVPKNHKLTDFLPLIYGCW